MTPTTPAQILASAELELARTVTTDATWYLVRWDGVGLYWVDADALSKVPPPV
jgi:hypothetical protein